LRFGGERDFRLRSATKFCEPSDRAVIGTLKRLDDSAGLFLVKRNRGQANERLLALVIIPVSAFCPLRFLMLKRFHEPMIVRGPGGSVPCLERHVV